MSFPQVSKRRPRRGHSSSTGDGAVMRTASDAVLSKLSAASMGYYDDPFLEHFAGGARGLTGRRGDNHQHAVGGGTGGGAPLPTPAEGVAGLQPPCEAVGMGMGAAGIDGRSPPHHHGYNRALSSPLPAPPPPPTNPFGACDPSSVHPALRGRCCGGGVGVGGVGGAHPPTRGAGGQPLMRRGTHARVCVIDRALSAFLGTDDEAGGSERGGGWRRPAGASRAASRQVVVLGAGRDTNYLRYVYGLLTDGGGDDKGGGGSSGAGQQASDVRWYEVDHPDVIKTKRTLLKSCPLIDVAEKPGVKVGCDTSAALTIAAREGVANGTSNGYGSSTGTGASPRPGHTERSASSSLHLLPLDLRSPPSELIDLLTSVPHGFDPAAPTLFVLECVMMYVPDGPSRTLLGELSRACSDAAVVVYDPVIGERGADPFGRVMEANLARAGVGGGGGTGGPIRTPDDGCAEQELSLTTCRTLDAQVEKLFECWCSPRGGRSTGCGGAAIACDMLSAYESVVPPRARARANGAEMLDEIEEWVLIMRHYCFAVATNGVGGKQRWLEKFAGVGEGSALGFAEGRCVTRRC